MCKTANHYQLLSKTASVLTGANNYYLYSLILSFYKASTSV